MAAKDIDTWDFGEIIDWLDKKDIDYSEFETLEEMKTLVKKKSLETPSCATTPAAVDGQEVLKDILEIERKMKEEIDGFYSNIQKLMTECDKGVHSVLTERFGDYMEQIKNNMDDLKQKECPILIVGETSSGKSSLINLLVGDTLLPTSLLAESSAICCLHNSTKIYFTVEYKDGNVKTEEFETAEELPGKLAEFICRKNVNFKANNGLKKIDVYFKLPFLPENTTMVDSPGVGEDDYLTQQVLQFLPKSVAFIYVIDSSNAGGIQQDKLGYILEEQKSMESASELVSYDFRNAIIICNKWDVVEDREEAKNTREQTLKNLRELMPNLNEDHIFEMSIRKDLRRQHLVLQPTEQFLQFLRGIRKILPTTILEKLNRHSRWQGKFLESIQFCINSRIKFAFSTNEEKQKLECDVMSKLKDLQTKSSQIIDELEEISSKKCESIVEALHSYLQRTDVLKSFSTWEDDPLLTKLHFADPEVLKRELKKRINLKLHLTINRWEAQEQILASVFKELEELLNERISSIDNHRRAIDKCFDEDLNDDNSSDRDTAQKSLNQMHKYMKKIETISETFLVQAFALGLKMAKYSGISWKGIHEMNVKKRLEEITSNVMCRENLKKMVNETYFEGIKKKINELFENKVTKEISAKKALLSSIMSDIGTTEEQMDILRAFQNDTEKVLKKFKTQESIYLD